MEEKAKTVIVIEQHERTIIRRTRSSVTSELPPVIDARPFSPGTGDSSLRVWSKMLAHKTAAVLRPLRRLLGARQGSSIRNRHNSQPNNHR
jgi:hypothetical protein